MQDLILTIDVGNTSTTGGVYEEGGLLRALFRFKTEKMVSPEELFVKTLQFLKLYHLEAKEIKGLSLASVVPSLESLWVEVGRRWFLREVVVASPESVKIPMRLRYPQEVGADRLVNVLAGWEKYRSALIIVDFGTAITFDCVSSEGVYLGGAIAPGVMLAMESLFRGTAKLPRIDLSAPPERAIGNDTVSALKSGLLLGFAGLTDYLIERLSEELGTKPLVVATGGLANPIATLSKRLEKIDPTLTLDGLYYLWMRR